MNGKVRTVPRFDLLGLHRKRLVEKHMASARVTPVATNVLRMMAPIYHVADTNLYYGDPTCQRRYFLSISEVEWCLAIRDIFT